MKILATWPVKASHYKLISTAPTDARGFQERAVLAVGNQEYACYTYAGEPTDISLKNAKSFKMQISLLNPYDDADYAWASVKNLTLQIIQKQKVLKKVNLSFNEENYEEMYDWYDEITQQALDLLEQTNSGVQEKIDRT